MKGRESAGQRLTIARKDPAVAIIAPAATSSLPMRCHSPTGAATRKATANPGTTRTACSILVRNASPSTTPSRTSHRVPAVSMARTMRYAANTRSRTRSASGLL